MNEELRERLKKVLHHDQIHNGIWLYFLQFFNTVLPVLTLPYITRIIGAEQYGLFNKALNIVVYFQVVVEYGFGMSATREVVIIRDDKKRVNLLFNAVIFSRFLLFLLCSIALAIILFIDGDYEKKQCLLILFPCLIGYCFQQNWLFLGMQEMKYISIVNITARMISTVLIFILVKGRSDILLYCFLYTISPIISGILGFIIAEKRYKLNFFCPKFKEIKQEIINGWCIFTTQFSGKILNIVGITFLGFFTSNYDIGVYSAINKLANLVVLLWFPISQVLYPISSKKMADSFEKGELFVLRLRKYALCGFGILIMILVLSAKWLVNLAFGAEYSAYYYLLIPQLIFILVAINNNFLGSQILLGGGYDKQYTKCFHVSVVTTILVNFLLIYRFGKEGAAFCSLISESILSVLFIVTIRKIKSERAVHQLGKY